MPPEFEIAGSDTLNVPASRMVGRAWLDHLATGMLPSRVKVVKAFFEPAARTVWHKHARGQIIHVVDGVLLVQERDNPPQAFVAGQTATCTPDVWHWHGADADHFLTQIAVIETQDDGEDATWGEQVDEDDYQSALASLRS